MFISKPDSTPELTVRSLEYSDPWLAVPSRNMKHYKIIHLHDQNEPARGWRVLAGGLSLSTLGKDNQESESLPCLPSGSPYPEPGPEESCASTKSHQEELRFPFYPV